MATPERGAVLTPERERQLRALCARGRGLVLQSVRGAGAGHVGGPLSAMEILVTLYFHVLSVDPARPRAAERDRFVLSKGHSSIGLYSVLAMRGFVPEAELGTFDHLGSRLQGHPDMTALDALDMSTGSLGQGLSVGLGMALGLRRRGLTSRVYVLMGDGECQEGQVWEAAHAATALGVCGLVAVVDQNLLPQFAWPGGGMGEQRRVALAARFEAFGWEVRGVDGHDIAALAAALQSADHPVAVIARTVKGRGVSFMEGDFRWHARVPTDEELARAAAELAEGGRGDA
jgi:transketolase